MTDTYFISSLQGDEASITAIATYLQYSVGKNPVDPTSDWRILFSDKTPDHGKGVIALRCEPDLTLQSKTIDVRRLYKKVEELKQALTTSFDVLVVGFVGVGRVVFFPFMNGNRDMRLDLNEDTITKQMYATNFQLMGNANLSVTEDEFGFGDYKLSLDIQKIFKRELTSTFLLMVKFYRKKLSELITSTSLKQALMPLVTENTKAFLVKDDLADLVQQESYTAVLSTVVDTIILRQLMRRFLEGYYGSEAFEVSGISLGVGSGTLDAAIKKAVQVAISTPDDTKLKKINQKHKALQTTSELDLFTGLFDEEELSATAQVGKMSSIQKSDVEKLTEHAREQFSAVYAGDLFSGSVGDVATAIEKQMARRYPEFVTKMWVDTSSDQFSFRYEDMAPESLEKQYESSMSENVQIMLNQQGQPTVYYGDDKQEQKQKGAYYTDQTLVDYVIKQTVEKQFMSRYKVLKEATQDNKAESEIRKDIEYILSMKIADLTCGGGSFLRGAFLKLSEKHELLSSLPLSKQILTDYPMFAAGDVGECKWEDYLLNRVIYGVDLDYKAITIASLTLTLSSLQHRNINQKLPRLIGNTLINQNALVNMINYSDRKDVFSHFRTEIATLRKWKLSGENRFEPLRKKLQGQIVRYAEVTDAALLSIQHGEILEINIPEVFFNEDGELLKNGGFTCVVGNPPWDILDANSDEYYEQYDRDYLKLPNAVAKSRRRVEINSRYPEIERRWKGYQEQVRAQRDYLNNPSNYSYQSWSSVGKKKASKPNLYKICLERFHQCLNSSGTLGVVVQDSFAYDGGAAGLRQLYFKESRVREYLSFENRRKIFKNVDSRFRFAVLIAEKQSDNINKLKNPTSFDAFFYQKSLYALEDSSLKFKYPLELVNEKPDLLSLIEVHSASELLVYRKISNRYKPLFETHLFSSGTDFNRTTAKQYFTTSSNDAYLLFQGRDIEQFLLESVPTEFVNGEAARHKLGEDLLHWRLAWRDIASSTNRRSIIATLLPPYVASTHSINIQRHLSSTDNLNNQCFYLGLLNSYVLDFFIRPLIGTHVSKYFLEQLPMPTADEFSDSQTITQIVVELLSRNSSKIPAYGQLKSITGTNMRLENMSRDELIAELNARVAIGFGMKRDEMIQVLKTFESTKHQKTVREESQRILNAMDKL